MSGHGGEVELPHAESDPFVRKVAFAVSIVAVILAFATFGGHSVSKEMMLLKADETQVAGAARQEEFNVWTQYQSKSTREALNRNERVRLVAERDADSSTFAAYKGKLLAGYEAEEKRMRADKDELAAQAKRIKEEGDAKVQSIGEKLRGYQRKDHYFDFAEASLQLAIVLASIAMLSKKRWAFAVSLVMACVGVALTIDGFTLVVPIGLVEGH